jgi:hypothetical protein
MTPIEKVEELISKFHPHTNVPKQENAIKCAIVTVTEIIKNGNLEFRSIEKVITPNLIEYWWKVLYELNKMK